MADPLSIAASIAGLITITQAALAGVHSLITVVKEYDDDMVKLVQELAAIEQLLQLLRNALPDYSDRVLLGNPAFEPLRLLQTTLQDVEKLKPKDSKREKALYITFRKDKTLKELLQRLERHKSTISSLLSVHQVDLLREALSGQATLSAKIDTFRDEWHAANTRHEKKELQQYYHSDHPYRLFKVAQKLHQEHTGEWFVNGTAFTNWIKSKRSKLWVYGIAGAGKTVLSSLAIQHANHQIQTRRSSTVIYFFCDNSIPESQDAKVIIGSLIYQLANSKKDALVKLEKLHAERSNSSLSLAGDQLDDLHLIFQELATHFDDISIVIDGLDECDKFREVSEELRRLSDDSLPTRLLFFSRDEIDIRNTLSSFQSVSISANNDDLNLYIASQIALHTQSPNGDLPVESQDVKDRIRERLAAGAQGAFRWVECQIDALCQCANETECEEILENLPEGLKGSYDRILDRINKLPSKYQHYVHKALQWTCTSRMPLTLKALCEIVALKDDGDHAKRPQPIHDRKLLHWCSSFLRHSTSDGLVEIAHYSVKEYLKEPKYAHFLVTDECNAQLGKACLDYLLLKDYQISDQTTYDEYATLLNGRPFRGYVIKHWVHHCTDEDGSFRNVDLRDLAKVLFLSTERGPFYSFSLESYLFGHLLASPWSDAPPPAGTSFPSFLEAQVRIAKVPPLHWSSSMWLWQLTKPLVDQSKHSIETITPFGTPIHCAIDRSFSSLKGFREVLMGDRMASTLRSLILCGADVNRKFDKRSATLLSNELPRLSLPTAKMLLQAGLMCDRKTLQALAKPSEPFSLVDPAIFQMVSEKNVFEIDREYWQRLRRGLLDTTANLPALPIHSANDPAGHASSTETVPDSSHGSGDEGEKQFDADETIEDKRNSRLLHATRAGDIDLIANLTSIGADLNHRDEIGQSPLHIAAKYGYVPVYIQLSNLVEHDSPVLDTLGRTPLHLAASNGAVGIVAAIYAESPRSHMLKAVDNLGYSPLHSAAQAGNLDCLQYLLEYGAEADAFKTTQMGMSALHLACKSGSSSAVRMLLGRGLDPNAQSNDGSAALHYAAATTAIQDSPDRMEILKILLEAGADPGVQRSDACLPIHVLSTTALRQSSMVTDATDRETTLLRSLIQGFANRGNKNNETALHLVCKSVIEAGVNLTSWISWMLDDGYDSLIENCERQSSLGILLNGFLDDNYSKAPSMSHEPSSIIALALQLVLEGLHRRVDDMSPEIRRTAAGALSVAIRHSLWGLCEQLVELVNDTSELDPDPLGSPLHLACMQPHLSPSLLQTIVSKASDFSRYDENGFAPLHRAVTNNLLHMVMSLVSHGADVNQREKFGRGRPPLFMALMRSKTGYGIVQYLIDSGADTSLRSSDGVSLVHQICIDGALDVLASVSRENIIAAGRINFHQKSYKAEYRWSDAGCLQLAAIHGHLDVVSYLLDRGLADVNEATPIDLITALHIAARNGNIPLAKCLIRVGADINPKNALGETPFHVALKVHHADMLHYLLDNGAYLSGENKSMVWMEVVGWNNFRVRHILEGAFKRDLQSQVISLSDVLNNYEGRTNLTAVQRILDEGLKYAIEAGNAELSAAILNHGASMESSMGDCGLCGALLYALRLDRPFIAAQLIQAGCKLDVAACRHHDTFAFDPATYAAWRGNHRLLSLILSKGYLCAALVHPIHVAIIMGHRSCVEVILNHALLQMQKTAARISSTGTESPARAASPSNAVQPSQADDYISEASSLDTKMPNAVPLTYQHLPLTYPIQADVSSWPWGLVNYQKGKGPGLGWTALHLAVKGLQPELVHLLLRYGANIEARDQSGCTPLHLAASRGNPAIVDILLEKGACPTAQTTDGETPLMKALDAGHWNLIKKLVSHETINLSTRGGWSPLHYLVDCQSGSSDLVRCGCVDNLEEFLNVGADIEATTRKGITPLHLAAEAADRSQALQHLLDREANVNARDSKGRTALFFAVERGYLENCKNLVQHGASIDVVDNDRETLLHAAVGDGFLDIARWLIEMRPSLSSANTQLGCTPLHFSLDSNNVETHLWALDQSSDYNLDCQSFCGSLLHHACRYGQVEAAQEMVQRLGREQLHALCRKTSQLFAPLLTLAVMTGNITIVQLLLDADVPMEITHPPWESPFAEAVRQHRHDVVRLLLVRTFNDMHKDSEEQEAVDNNDSSSQEEGGSGADSSSGKGDVSARDTWVETRFKELFENTDGGSL